VLHGYAPHWMYTGEATSKMQPQRLEGSKNHKEKHHSSTGFFVILHVFVSS
jgi:hypothetical protein